MQRPGAASHPRTPASGASGSKKKGSGFTTPKSVSSAQSKLTQPTSIFREEDPHTPNDPHDPPSPTAPNNTDDIQPRSHSHPSPSPPDRTASYPYIIMGIVAVVALLTPLVALYESLPEAEDFGPFHSHPDPSYTTRSVVNKPLEGVHFRKGELSPQGRLLGPKDGEKWVIEFTDFFCTHCRDLHDRIVEPLLKDYASKGLLRVESHPIAILHDESLRAAHAALCGQEQHKYWEVRDLLFRVNVTEREYGPGGSAFSGAVLKQIAGRAGLDLLAFLDCFKSGRYKEEIRSITDLARELGIKETPTLLFSDGKRVVGSKVTLADVKKRLGLT